MQTNKKQGFLDLLNHELITALGCTEPIALAYASAKAREVLGEFPTRIEVFVSNNIVKNVKSVAVPNSDGLKGIDVACVLGVVGGCADLKLEVLSTVTAENLIKTKELLKTDYCAVLPLKSVANLHIIVKAFSEKHNCEVELKDKHDNIVNIIKDSQTIFHKDESPKETLKFDFSLKDVFAFVQNVEIEKVKDLIERQMTMNMAISEEGMKNDYGQRIGKTLLSSYPNDVNLKARAMAAAGSDARMNGCAMPVVINSGSGNQGITLCVPICVFSKEFKKDKEITIRAVLLSNLVSIYIKNGIGKLSAFCGAVSASSGVAAGLTYLMNGTFLQVEKAITNTVANISGIVCDGAKSSCAAKISSSVDAGIMAYYMAIKDNAFCAGDGIIDNNIEGTIENVSRLGKEGMKETDDEIISIMLNKR